MQLWENRQFVNPKHSPATDTKKRICELKLAGYTNENIAKELKISVDTVILGSTTICTNRKNGKIYHKECDTQIHENIVTSKNRR